MNFLDTSIEFAKGVGPKRAEVLKSELKIGTFKDLLLTFPFRHVDRSAITKIADLPAEEVYIQVRGVLTDLSEQGNKTSKRLVGHLSDGTSSIELIWFRSVSWIQDSLVVGKKYLVYGRLSLYKRKKSIAHPDMEEFTDLANRQMYRPVYSSTEKLLKRGIDNRLRSRIVKELFKKLPPHLFSEYLPKRIVETYRLLSPHEAIKNIHFPQNAELLLSSKNRLKFDELFLMQIGIVRRKIVHSHNSTGPVFQTVGERFNRFYHNNLNFELTNAQKRVVKEIRKDTKSSRQMNRLLQGDVGSGKTVVAFLAMLLAVDNGFQTCLMAPTEILAHQHNNTISKTAKGLKLNIGLLTGSIKGNQRKNLLNLLENGQIHILIGTHALIEDKVKFHNLGLAITDEQHRFGVAQRSMLWTKNLKISPHILVMTATPIPRTLAMTRYGELDLSIINELPPGRKPVNTIRLRENERLRMLGLIKREVDAGRQAYIVYPLIEESEKLDLLNLESGFNQISNYFKIPDYQVGILHGRMKAEQKEMEMNRFANGTTNIMVSTTVIEVGVDVPNATVMAIENAERFGLSQLHQLRGRVGRGAERSYCILMTGERLTTNARKRIKIMCETNDGFRIAEEDLKIRGPGTIDGLQQSGSQLKLADLATDTAILSAARQAAIQILKHDPQLKHENNKALKIKLLSDQILGIEWSQIG